MIGGAASIAFLNPWMLAALALLPALWLLLRVMPPAPRRIVLPTADFLNGLVADSQTPAATPWWIVLLRIMICALLITALAQPVRNPEALTVADGPLRLVIDNGWSAAPNWAAIQDAALRAAEKTGRIRQPLYIITTAAAHEEPAMLGPLSAAQAGAMLRGLRPQPWGADYEAVRKAVSSQNLSGGLSTLWLSDGLDGAGRGALARALAAHGPLEVITPTPEQLPLLLTRQEDSIDRPGLSVVASANADTARLVTVQALARDGTVLDVHTLRLQPGTARADVTFDMPAAQAARVDRYKIASQAGTGSVFALDGRDAKKPVGLAGPGPEAETKPFVEARYYLRRALDPFTHLREAPLDDLLRDPPAAIILPDIGALPAGTMNALDNWVRGGGLLIRFAGPAMSTPEGSRFLVPVPLHPGIRATQGRIAWENAPQLTGFPATSPFYGLPIRDPVIVREQILAEPGADLRDKSWATLSDGTPLVTAARREQGLIVMIHTSAAADWSDLPLSGVYVGMLRRLVDLAGLAPGRLRPEGLLQPLWVLDGMGAATAPGADVLPVDTAAWDKARPGPRQPPGLYGAHGTTRMLNIGTHLAHIDAAHDFAGALAPSHYGAAPVETDLAPLLLALAAALFVFDWLVMIVTQAELRALARVAVAGVVLLLIGPGQAHAQDAGPVYAKGLYLAYIRTGDLATDALSREGLEALAAALSHRTSAEPDGVASIDPATDTMAFFPLIYWPLSGAPALLPDAALQNIQHYLDHGGTLLIDTRGSGSENNPLLARTLGALSIPPLAPIAPDHVLQRTFYLLDSFPGRIDSGILWVQNLTEGERDGVSPVLIGDNDWAAAWAEGGQSNEHAMRFGVNVMMYALTGNYKADQVHVPYILERLGR